MFAGFEYHPGSGDLERKYQGLLFFAGNRRSGSRYFQHEQRRTKRLLSNYRQRPSTPSIRGLPTRKTGLRRQQSQGTE